MEVAVDGVDGEHAAEEHDFGDQEDPHAERGGVLLLCFVIELHAKREGFGVRVISQLPSPLPSHGAVIVRLVGDDGVSSKL